MQSIKSSGVARASVASSLIPCHPTLITHRVNTIARATLAPGSTPDKQRVQAGSLDVEVPLAAVQQLPIPAQSAVFAGIVAAISAGAYLLCTQTDLSWTHSSSAPYIFGITFTLAGVGHFTAHDDFCTMMPHQGAWGIWYLPGSDSFHVNWTGVVEILGGLSLLASQVPQVAETAPWLQSTAALVLFWLSVVVTPSNIYMYTHNAPGPGPKGEVIPLPGHAFRGVMQIVLWTALWGLAHAPAP